MISDHPIHTPILTHRISLTMSMPPPPGPRRNPSRKSKALTLPSIQEDSDAPQVSPSYNPNAERNEQRSIALGIKWHMLIASSKFVSKHQPSCGSASRALIFCPVSTEDPHFAFLWCYSPSGGSFRGEPFCLVTSCPDPFLAHEIGVCMGCIHRIPQPRFNPQLDSS